jgi:hypothetical protein
MKLPFILPIAAVLMLTACAHETRHKATVVVKPTIRLTLLPLDAPTPKKTTTVQAKLNDIEERTLITDDMLEVTHTQKLHLLLIDSTLTDYQHIHPQPNGIPGVYSFSFTPKMPGGYRAWADVTPIATHKQEFAMTDLGGRKSGAINKTKSHEATVNGYHFTLSFDTPPVEGGESTGTIMITDRSGNPVTSLQPVMGAFAHVVGFYDDFKTIIHTHPMNAEPVNETQRGGPEVTFHLAPERSGFLKLFAQVKINGQEIFVPFGITIAAGFQ